AGESLTAGSTSHTTAVPTIAPSIKHQPTEKIVSVGSSVTMQVIAAGSPTPTYQWRKNKVAIPGATSSSYTIASAQLGDIGSYDVVVTNSQGSLVSASTFVFAQ